MKSLIKRVLAFLFFLTLTILLIIAHNSYPQGGVISRGWYLSDLSSPASNPAWVRFLQNYGVLIGLIAILGTIYTFVRILDKDSKIN